MTLEEENADQRISLGQQADAIVRLQKEAAQLRAERDEARDRNDGKDQFYEKAHRDHVCPHCNAFVKAAHGYRCVDCDRWYHRECLRKHCASDLDRELSEARAQLGATRDELEYTRRRIETLTKENP